MLLVNYYFVVVLGRSLGCNLLSLHHVWFVITLSATSHELVHIAENLRDDLRVVVTCRIKNWGLSKLKLLSLSWILCKLLSCLTSLATFDHFLIIHRYISPTLLWAIMTRNRSRLWFILNFWHKLLLLWPHHRGLCLKDIRWLCSWSKTHAKLIREIIWLNHCRAVEHFSITSLVALLRMINRFRVFVH